MKNGEIPDYRVGSENPIKYKHPSFRDYMKKQVLDQLKS